MAAVSIRTARIAVVGNPNSGKTTLFNSLTGSNQKVANYPGVTVERVSAPLKLGDRTAEVIDIPGVYSLDPQSEDERVATEAILGLGSEPLPDVYLVVLNAASLERNLFLFSQLAETRRPMVVALTMGDLLAPQGLELQVAKLANLLGVEVVPVIGHRSKGLVMLKEALERQLQNPKPADHEFGRPIAVETKVASLRERFARFGWDTSAQEIREALQSEGAPLDRKVEEVAELAEALTVARRELAQLSETRSEVADRYQWAEMVTAACLTPTGQPPRDLTAKLDRVLTHRVFGLGIFIAIMYGVFLAIYQLAEPLMALIEQGFAWLGETVGARLEGNPMLQSAVVDGVIAGVGGVIVFLPQILILFALIAILEGSGYLARAAFLMDRLLGWCGLNGRAFIPLLSSYACAIPGIMAARVMPDARSRLATILVAPLMSCSARLPVYLLLIGAFIAPKYGPWWAGFALFAMHLLGFLVAIPVVLILNRGFLKGKRLPFLLELPPYQWPKPRDLFLAVWFRGLVFLKTAGTIIFAMSILIWGLSYFPRSEAADARYRAEIQSPDEQAIEHHIEQRRLEDSFLGRSGRLIAPVFEPAGFDWRITTAILAAFPAREVVVPSLGIMFSVGGDQDESSPDIRRALSQATWPDGRPLMTPWTAVGLMVFFALCAQCMATLATVKRETNSWKWAGFMFAYMTLLAYLGAVLVNQLGRFLGGS